MRIFPRTQEQADILNVFHLSEQEAEQESQQEQIPWHCVCCEPIPNADRYTSGMHPACRAENYPRRGGAR